MATNEGNDGTNQGVGLPVGSKIGKYEVVERSGMGGQSIVYKCYDRSLDRFVAAKQISPHLAEDPKFVEHFRREAQILARLGAEQTSIVTIHELLEEPQGLFIVMEFVQGHTLETILHDTNGPTETKAALQIIWRLAAALHAVHTAGILHRDLKPANIIVAEGLRPKITDFGVAASRTGQTSMLLGTTKYMAPELFAGGDADGRVDMYSLGMISYEMLLGRPRFREVFAEIVRDPHSEPLRWMKWHSNDQEAAPKLHDLDPSIPEPLSDIVARMMAKKRDDRFESMEALGRAIRVSFSPRGKAVGTPAAGAPASPRKGERAKAGAAMASDEGDELEIHAPPPTAEIPHKPISLRTKLVAAGLAFAVLLTGMIVLVVKSSRQRARLEDAARKIYQDAEDSYKAGRFEEALRQFEQVSPKYPGTSWAAKALVLAPLTQSRLYELDANTPEEWEKVAVQAKVAEDQANNVLARDKALADWARGVLTDIKDLDNNRTILRKFREKMTQATEAFQARRYAEAIGILDRLDPAGFSEDQKKQREALRQKAARADFEAKFAAEVARGDDLALLADFKRELDYDQAKAAYDRAQAMLQANTVLLPVEVDAKSKELLRKLDLLNKKRDYRQALEDLAKADTPQKKLDALLKRQKIENSLDMSQEETKKLIAQAQAENFTKQAQEALDAGKFVDARRSAEAALQASADYKPAQDILDKLKRGEDRGQLIKEGGTLFTQGNYSEALAKYTQANDLAADEDLAAKIKICQFQLKVKAADALAVAGKFDEAIKLLEEARPLNPADAALIDAREASVRTAKEYRDLVAKGDQAMKDKKYTVARGFYTDASKKTPLPEVMQKIALASYNENLEHGKESLAAKDGDGARAYFKIAQGHVQKAGVDPKEVEALIQQADEMIKGPKP
jgi:serine/threonine protein kinase